MIKVDIVSGFLGAGKTTLIKKLLKAYENEKVVLIENEYGEIGIDGDLIEREGFEVFEISSGCICCIMKNDFTGVLNRVIKEFSPERIIVEPTGLSILSEIIAIFNTRELSEKCSINSLITVIDSMNYLEQCDIFGEFFEDQIINAETLILSKSQYIDDENLEEIIKSLRQYNDHGEIITSRWDNLTHLDIRKLLDKHPDIEFKELFHTEYKPCRENDFTALGIETSKKFTRIELEEVLEELKDPKLGKILRGKGFLKGYGTFFEFSYTNGQFIVIESNLKCSGKLCLIGKNLNEEEIKALFITKGGGFLNWLKL